MSTEHRVILDLPVLTVPTRSGERTLVIDLYLPVSEAPTPLLMYVHGGGWAQGTQYRPPFRPRLFDQGIAVAAITYRFSSEAPFPACLHDCKTMLRYLRSQAQRFNLDPSRIALWGLSAGGHLVSLLGVTADRPEWEGDGPYQGVSTAVTAVVNWCGPSDLVRTATDPMPGLGIHPLVIGLIGGPYAERMDVARAASPITHVHAAAAPHLMVHGALDTEVPVWNAEIYHQALLAAGAASELVINPRSTHSLTGDLEAEATARFLEHHLLSS